MRRVLYILGVILVSITLVGSTLVAVLMSSRVETAAVRLVTAELSRSLGTKVQIGSVDYQFPAQLTLHDVLLEDQQQDTLAFIGDLYADFKPARLRKNEIKFSHVHLNDIVANVYQLPDSTWNYQFLLPESSEDESSSPFRSLLSVQDIRLDNIRLRYEDYEVQLAHAVMDLNRFTEHEIDAQISELAATVNRKPSVVSSQQSVISGQPFEVSDLKAHLILNDTILALPTLSTRLPNSVLDLSGIEVKYPSGDTLYLSKSAHEITFALDFHEAKIVPSDLAFFVPRLKNVKRPIGLTGHLGGTLDSLAFKGITVRYNNAVVVDGDVSAVGLPDLNNPYVRANVKTIKTNAPQLQDFLSQLYGHPVRLPEEVHRLGDIHYRGLAEGHLHDLTLHGAFRTALGVISTDGSIRSDSLFEHMNYDARIVAKHLSLGKLIGHEPLKSATFDIESRGQINEGKVHGDIKAHVRELTYNDYTFEDLNFDGRYEPKRYNGHCDINDPHMAMTFDGVVDVHDVNPEINFNLRCHHFDMSPFMSAHKRGATPSLTTRFALAVDLDGIETDRMNGYMVLDSLFLATPLDSLLMRQMTLLVTAREDHSKQFTLNSDYLHAKANGVFRYKDLAPAMKAMLHHYLPSAVEAPEDKWQAVSMNLTADGRRLRDIQRLYSAPITLSDHPSLQAQADLKPNEEPSVEVRFSAPGVRAGDTPVHDLLAELRTLPHVSEAAPTALALSVSAEAMQVHTVFSSIAFADSLLTHLTLQQESQVDELLPEGWKDLSPRELQRALSDDLSFREKQRALLAAQRAGYYGGDIKAVTTFSKYQHRPLIDVHLLPGTLILKDSVYTLSDSRLTYCAADTAVQVEHFRFEGAGQHLGVHGIVSSRVTDTLNVDLRAINAAYIVPFVLPVQTIMFNGLLTGQARIASVLGHPDIDTRIHIDEMGLNNCLFGDAEVDLHIKDSLAFHADVYQRETRRTVVDLYGKALFGEGIWELDMQTDSVPLAFINHWTANVLRNLDGHATGRVVVGGKPGLTYVLLRAAAQNASLTLPWTGARYTIPEDTIVMDTFAIRFPDVHMVDAEGNPVFITGSITHDQFRDFHLDLHVDAKDALVFDSEQKGEMLQGHVFANGHVDVTGPENDLVISVNAVTSNNSRFRLSIDNVASAGVSSFVHFVQHLDSTSIASSDTIQENELDNIDNAPRPRGRVITDSLEYFRPSKCLIKLALEVNPRLQFQLVLGERNGDRIVARGSGALRLTYDTSTGAVKLLGTYDIESGTLSYTIANVIRKEFIIGEGATIVFSGNPSDPQLDVTAKYRVTANIRDLFGDEADQLATSRSNIPVLTCLHLTGQLSNPILSFSLEFPQSDQSIQAQVKQVINTDEMLMRQVIYLLVFGRFFTPDYMTMSQNTTLNSTYSLLSSTVTSQINSWLSKLTDIVTLGVAIRSDGEGANESSEYEAQIHLQPVDRLVINGNVGYRYNDISNQPFFGDLDVEVLLTEDGQWRMKGYTHTVDKYSLRQASTIQGIGFMWKKDFNWPATKRKDKKIIEQKIEQVTDSIQRADSIRVDSIK